MIYLFLYHNLFFRVFRVFRGSIKLFPPSITRHRGHLDVDEKEWTTKHTNHTKKDLNQTTFEFSSITFKISFFVSFVYFVVQ